MLWVIKHGSGVLYFVSTALVIPIVSLVSATEWYSSLGLESVEFSVWQIVGLCVVVIGCGLYIFFLRREADPERIRARSLAKSLKDLASGAQFQPSDDREPLTDDEYYDDDWYAQDPGDNTTADYQSLEH